MQNVKAIRRKFQHALVIADIDKKKIRNDVRKTCTERRQIILLKDFNIRKRFEQKVTELIDVAATNMRGHIMDGVLKACGEVCGKKRGRISKGDTWWLIGDVR